MDYFIRHICPTGAFVCSAIMSWREIRTREVIDRELAWLSFFTIMPTAMAPESRTLTQGAVPLWMQQTMTLLSASGGALIRCSITGTRHFGKDLIGKGDLLFTLAIGFMLPCHYSPSCFASPSFWHSLHLHVFSCKKREDPPPHSLSGNPAFLMHWVPHPSLVSYSLRGKIGCPANGPKIIMPRKLQNH